MGTMVMLVGYTSALAYWRLVGPSFVPGYRAREKATHQARASLAMPHRPQLGEGNRRPAGCALPVHALVGDAAARTETKSVVSHTWASVPDKSFINAGNGFLVSTPEFCFLQMAALLPLAQLVQLGMELCGTYALVEDGPAATRDAPLTTVTRLRTFVDAAHGMSGRAKALRAVRYVENGSASPMESILAMMLYLPYKLGGYGLERPVLNHQVDVPHSMRSLADRSYCRCDLCWPSRKLAVEYDSRLRHEDLAKQESDARRRSTLIALGFTVVTVFPPQVMDGGAFNRLARQLAKLTGKRLRYEDPGFTRKHLALREQLFEGMATER